MKKLLLSCLFILSISCCFAQSETDAVKFKVQKAFINKDPKKDVWEDYAQSNGSSVIWDVPNEKFSLVEKETQEYVIIGTEVNDKLKEKGYSVTSLTTVDKDNTKVFIELTKHQKDGKETDSEVVIDYGDHKVKFQLAKA